jgi:hypothetical protein
VILKVPLLRTLKAGMFADHALGIPQRSIAVLADSSRHSQSLLP